MPRQTPPLFQSFGSARQTRVDAARGAFSRSSPVEGSSFPHGGGGRPPY